MENQKKYFMDFKKISTEVVNLLNRESDKILPKQSIKTVRIIADTVETYLTTKGLEMILGEKVIQPKSRKSMEDCAVIINENTYYIDIKTHNMETAFNMPNLTSLKGLNKFYKDSNNVLCIMNISYYIAPDGSVVFEDCLFRPIENISWKSLRIGALGNGQIQLKLFKNLNDIKIDENLDRNDWIREMYINAFDFIDNEKQKLDKFKNQLLNEI